METVNRGWLKKQVEKGNVVCISSYHYDEMMGQSQTTTETPVRLETEGERFRAGWITLSSYDFKTKSGTAYRNENGTITLIIHSNLNYDLKLK